jgi:hypothetical protein
MNARVSFDDGTVSEIRSECDVSPAATRGLAMGIAAGQVIWENQPLMP